MSSRKPVIKVRHGVRWWAYDFTFEGIRHRGWISPVGPMRERGALKKLNQLYSDLHVRKDPAPIVEKRPRHYKLAELTARLERIAERLERLEKGLP